MIKVGHKTNDLIAVVIYLQSSMNKPFHSDWLYGGNDAIAITIKCYIALVYRLWLNRHDTHYSYDNLSKNRLFCQNFNGQRRTLMLLSLFFTPNC